jgi:teichuronic acid biosynthesis glycosyltransferase TuaC
VRVLSFSYCFPNHARPTWGVFVLQRLTALAEQTELQVVSPVPTFPVLTRLRGCPGPVSDNWNGLTVHRPKYFYVPGVLKWLDGPLYDRGLRGWLAELCGRWRPDLLDAHFVWPDGVGVSRLARAVGLPYTITLRGWLYESMKHPRILSQCVEALRGAAAVIALSSHLAETAVELGAPAQRMHVIPNGVDVGHFRPRDKADARRQLNLPEDRRLVVSVAHLGPRKGHRETIRALTSLPEDVQLVIVGGDPGRGHNQRELRGLIRELGLTGRVLLTGRQPYDRVPLYFNAADISVLASYREGCPNVVLESLASGTPVVASDVGSVSEMIEHGRNGRIVPPRQVEPLADAIGQLLDRSPSPQEVCNSPAVRSWDDVAADTYNVLRRAVQSGRLGEGPGGQVDDVTRAREAALTTRGTPEEA